MHRRVAVGVEAVLGLVVVSALGQFGCDKGRAQAKDDCAIVREQPADAMAALSKRYPKNPVKVAQTIENCLAPAGEDDCGRIAKIIAGIPMLAPPLADVNHKLDVVAICRTAPVEFRRCLLPSYALAHQDECANTIARTAETIAIAPRTATSAGGVDCGFVAIYVDEHGTWLATGRDAKARCFGPRYKGALDQLWLESQLRRVKALACSPSAVELATAGDVVYQDVITTMDTAIKVGLVDVGLTGPAELSVALAGLTPLPEATDCPASTITSATAGSAGAVPVPVPPRDRRGLAAAPVVVITTDKITLTHDKTSTDIATVDEVMKAGSKIDALTQALPKAGSDGTLIVQADKATPGAVIAIVMATAKAAGYGNLLFAVKNQP